MARSRARPQPGDIFRCQVFFALKGRSTSVGLTLRAADQIAAAAAAQRRTRALRASGKLRRIIVEAVT